MTEEKPKRIFPGVWIPASMWNREDLSLMEKALWAEISVLQGKEGCFASNEYFAKFFKCSKKAIEKNLSNLRKKKVIYTSKFDGRKRHIKISITESYEQKEDLPIGSRTLEIEDAKPSKSRTIDNSIATLSKEREKKSTPPPKIQVKDNLHMTQKEIDKLKDKYSIEAYEWMVEKLSNWKASTGKKTKDDYRTILSWVVEAYEARQASPQKKQPDTSCPYNRG